VSHIRAFASHGVLAVLEAGIIALIVLTLLVAPALAAKGGGGSGGKPSGGSLQLVVLDGVDAFPNHTERVTFNVVAPGVDRPFVGLRCWQGESWVSDAYVGYFDAYMYDPWFVLDSPYWIAGTDASCVARLFSYNRRGGENVIASMTFAVAP